MKKANKAVNYFLIVLTIVFFSTLFVLAILIARGELLTTDGIVETGILKLEIEPKDANALVYLDNEPIKLVDKRINNLPAGEYSLRIEADNYSTWEKQIQVNNGIVKELYIRLFPAIQEIVQVTNSNIDQVFFSTDGEYAYYVVKDSELAADQGIWQLELAQSQIFFSKNEPQKIAALDEAVLALLSTDYVIVGSPDGSKIILQNSTTSERMILTVGDFPQKNSTQMVSDLLGFEPMFVAWLGDSNSLLVADHGALFEYDLQSNRKNLIEYIHDHDVSFSASKGIVYFLDNNGKLMSYSSGNLTVVALKTALLPTGVSRIITSTENPNVLLLQTEDGSFVYVDIEHDFAENIAIVDAKYKSISADGSTIIFESSDKYMLYLSDHILAENKVVTSIIDPGFSVGAIENIEFNALSTHIVMHDKQLSQIRMAEKDGSNSFTLMEQVQTNAAFGFDNKARVFYILLVDEGDIISQPISNLYKIELE